MAGLPGFTVDGRLPPGDYELTLQELVDSPLVVGPEGTARSPHWDGPWRRRLVANLEVLVKELWAVGVREVLIDGSFVEAKDHPNDIDGYFECELERPISGELERELNLLNPLKVWTWDPASRRLHRGTSKRQLPMWHAYRVELYPHVGQLSGMRDEHGHELEFPAAPRRSREGRARGIVRIGGGP